MISSFEGWNYTFLGGTSFRIWSPSGRKFQRRFVNENAVQTFIHRANELLSIASPDVSDERLKWIINNVEQVMERGSYEVLLKGINKEGEFE